MITESYLLGLQHGVIHEDTPYGLPSEIKLLPQYLNNLGYVSRSVGKWHLGHCSRVYTPTSRGFKSHHGYWGGKEDYFTHVNIQNTKLVQTSDIKLLKYS